MLMIPRRPLLTILAAALALDALPQCGTTGVPLTTAEHYPAVQRERGGPAAFVLPTVLHIYYNEVIPPLAITRVPDLLDQVNRDLRGENADTADVCSAFSGALGDLNVELRLATIDPNGNCMSGVQYHWYDIAQGITPNIAPFTLNTAGYFNVHIYPAQLSFSTVPMPGYPVPGAPDDVVVLSSYDAGYRPRVLSHEVGHWVGLYHTFGPTNTSAQACGDDYVSDTPETMGSAVGTCDTTLSVCTPGVVENVDNQMDYSACPKMFSQGQATRVNFVMTDSTYTRSGIHQPGNLAATGVYLPSTCSIAPQWHYRTESTCGSTQLWFRAMAEGQVPDQVTWSFPGGSPATFTGGEPVVTYTTSGTYQVSLEACHNGVCNTITAPVAVTMNTGNTNGLTPAALPFSEGFENGFGLPSAHVRAAGGPDTWQLTGATGHASTHSLLLAPQPPPYGSDTFDVVLGNFDLSQLVQPALRFKIAATYYDTMRFTYLRVFCRDLCDASQPEGPWLFLLQPGFAGANTQAAFFPASDAQWTTVQAILPSSGAYLNAEVRISLLKNALPYPPFTDEPVWIDDIELFDAALTTGLSQREEASLLHLFPVPAAERLTLVTTLSSGRLSVFDAQGRMVLDQPMQPRMELDVSELRPGVYVAVVRSGDRLVRERFVVE